MLQDRILAILSMAMMVTFMGIVVWYVAEPSLTIIVVIVLVMGAYDFWLTVGPQGDAGEK